MYRNLSISLRVVSFAAILSVGPIGRENRTDTKNGCEGDYFEGDLIEKGLIRDGERGGAYFK